MIRGTTPTLVLVLDDVDLTGQTFEVYLRGLKNGQLFCWDNSMENVSLHDVTPGTSTVYVDLSQEDTLKLEVGKAEVQVRFINHAGVALATNVVLVDVDKILKDSEIEYAG